MYNFVVASNVVTGNGMWVLLMRNCEDKSRISIQKTLNNTLLGRQ